MELPPQTEPEKNALLKSVSRSFYLTIRALPQPLRHPIRTAYLLARATDTIADTVRIPLADRQKHLCSLRRIILENTSPQNALELDFEVAPWQSNPAEKILLARLPEILTDYQSLEPADHADVRWVLEQIITGQEEDLLTPQLTTDAALERYTWLVAGCVGEFWTRLCARKLRRFANRPSEEMLVLGADFGKGLQLVNILRDLPEDRANGRYYLPHLINANLATENTEATEENGPGAPSGTDYYHHWLRRTNELLTNGWQYVLSLHSWRLRFACALPILIGQQTLLLLASHPGPAQRSKVKISRSKIRQILFQTALRSASPQWLAGSWKTQSS